MWKSLVNFLEDTLFVSESPQLEGPSLVKHKIETVRMIRLSLPPHYKTVYIFVFLVNDSPQVNDFCLNNLRNLSIPLSSIIIFQKSFFLVKEYDNSLNILLIALINL